MVVRCFCLFPRSISTASVITCHVPCSKQGPTKLVSVPKAA